MQIAYASSQPTTKPRRTGRQWTPRERLAWTWNRNPNFSSGAGSKRRYKEEGQLARAMMVRDAIIAQLQRRARHSARQTELLRAAAQLAMVTPEGLGVEELKHPPPGGGKRQLPYLIPDNAAKLVRAFLALFRWACRLIDENHRAAYRAQLLRQAAMLRAIALDDLLPTRVPPHTRRPERETESLSLSDTSGPPLPDWLIEIRARRLVGGGEEVR